MLRASFIYKVSFGHCPTQSCPVLLILPSEPPLPYLTFIYVRVKGDSVHLRGRLGYHVLKVSVALDCVKDGESAQQGPTNTPKIYTMVKTTRGQKEQEFSLQVFDSRVNYPMFLLFFFKHTSVYLI